MIQRRDCARLAFEALCQFGFVRQIDQDLDSHRAVQPGVASFVHLSHPSRPNKREDFVGAELSSRLNWHWRSAL